MKDAYYDDNIFDAPFLFEDVECKIQSYNKYENTVDVAFYIRKEAIRNRLDRYIGKENWAVDLGNWQTYTIPV